MKNTKRLTLMILAAAVMPLSLANPALGFEPDAMSAKAAPAPSMNAKAKEIWDRSLEESMKGKKGENWLQNMRLIGTMSMPSQGISAEMNVLIVNSKGMQLSIEIPGLGSFEQGVSGDVVWSNSMMEGPKILEGNEATQLLKEIDLYADLNWEQYYQSISYTGEETIEMPDDTKITTSVLELVSIEDGTPSTRYYSTETGLLAKAVTEVSIPGGAKMPSTAYTMDYRDISGMMIPFKSISLSGPMKQVIEFSSVEINGEIGDDELALPEDIKELLED